MSGLRARLMARFYDASIAATEQRCLRAWRAALLGDLHGEVLEIGVGTGINLEHYPRAVTALKLCEPEAAMRERLQERLAAHAMSTATVLDSAAEALPLGDASVDHAVSTLVLCSVGDLEATLAEIHRVLKPGGTLRYMEHVHADDDPRLARWQHRLEPIWRWCAGNCHLTRETAAAIERAGFHMPAVQRVRMLGAPAVVQPMIKGVAVKPAP